MGRRAYSSKTRIKTLPLMVNLIVFMVVGEHIPVKQGLRRMTYHTCGSSRKGRRAYSSKTRIKTWFPHHLYPNMLIGRRAYSSKTRIKTSFVFKINSFTNVGEHIPVKQGLRLDVLRDKETGIAMSASIFQ